MSTGKITRRDFLKLLGVLPLSHMNLPCFNLGMRCPTDSTTSERLPNILIVVFDALSAKHMSLYGYPRRTTPNLERIAEKATVFHRHYACANFTTPGTASLFTGTYPWSHRAFHIRGRVDDAYVDKQLFHLFAENYNTFVYSHNYFVNILFHQFRRDIHQLTRRLELCLASLQYADKLFHEDYVIASLAESLLFWRLNTPPSSFFASRFNRSRRHYFELFLGKKYRRTFPRGVPSSGMAFFTIEQALEWLKVQFEELPQPFVGYIHLFPPHYPYSTQDEFVDLFDDGWQPETKPEHFFTEGRPEAFLALQRRMYDEFIAYVDAQFGYLYDYMERTGILDHTYVLFTSDHGEMFERGIWAHDTPTLFEPIVLVPLLIWGPRQDRRKDIFSLTSCVDVLPTMLQLAGKPIPAWCDGRVLPTYGNRGYDVARGIFAIEAKENPMHAPLNRATVALIKERYKLIRYFGYEGYQDEYELFDLEEDPDELMNLYPFKTSVASAMQGELIQMLATVDQPYR